MVWRVDRTEREMDAQLHAACTTGHNIGILNIRGTFFFFFFFFWGGGGGGGLNPKP